MTIATYWLKYRVEFLATLAAGVFLLSLHLLVDTRPRAGDLPAFEHTDIEARKRAFFDYLRPIAKYHNDRIREDRIALLNALASEPMGWFDKRRVRKLAARYGIDLARIGLQDALPVLRRRIDIVPESLVLVQAAKESAWGRSRFAREGNALFGEWCFTEGCGMVPGARGDGRTHEVRAFRDVSEAVASYMHNLNTHGSYVDLRVARQLIRQEDREPTGMELARYLAMYSERRDAYVREVQAMIRQNELETAR